MDAYDRADAAYTEARRRYFSLHSGICRGGSMIPRGALAQYHEALEALRKASANLHAEAVKKAGEDSQELISPPVVVSYWVDRAPSRARAFNLDPVISRNVWL